MTGIWGSCMLQVISSCVESPPLHYFNLSSPPDNYCTVPNCCFLHISVTVDPLRPSDQIELIIIIIIIIIIIKLLLRGTSCLFFSLARYGCGGMETRNHKVTVDSPECLLRPEEIRPIIVHRNKPEL